MKIIGVKGRLLGFRVVEQDKDHMIFKVPFYLRKQIPQIVDDIKSDMDLVDANLRITHSYSLIRVDKVELPQNINGFHHFDSHGNPVDADGKYFS